MLKGNTAFFILTILFLASKSLGAFVITGQVPGVSKCYYPRVYLAAIDDIQNLSGISNRLIVAQADINSTGAFEIKGDFLPSDKRLYRLYFTPEKDMNAYISVGGNENFVILILDNSSQIQLQCTTICIDFPYFDIVGMPESTNLKALKALEIKLLEGLEDSISETRSSFLTNQIINSYKHFADTSSQVLSSLLAVMAVLHNEGYITNKPLADTLLVRMKKEMPQSAYTTQFEKLINEFSIKADNKQPGNNSYLMGFVIMVIAFLISIGINIYLTLRLKKQASSNNETEMDYLSLLTIKEKQILLMVDDGLSNKEIAEKLNVELSTIKSHVSRIYQKTNIKNRSQVAKIARLLR